MGNLSPRTLPRPAGWGRRSKYTCMLRCPGGGGAAPNILMHVVVRQGGGAPHQIHVYASLSGRAGGAAANTLIHFVVRERWGGAAANTL